MTTKKNGIATAVDAGAFALTFAAPEAKLVAFTGEAGAKIAEVGVAGVGLTAAAVGSSKGPSGVVNGIVGYHFMMGNWASFKNIAGTAIRIGGQITGATALAMDAYNTYSDYKDCKAGKS